MSKTGAGPSPPERSTGPTHERVVTIDLDDATPLDVVSAYQTLVSAGCYDVEARVSSGGEGAHVRGWLDADDADEDDVEQLRREAGDHPRRTEMDRAHASKPPQVLFSRKPSGRAGPWRDDPHDAADDLRRRSSRYGLDAWLGEVHR